MMTKTSKYYIYHKAFHKEDGLFHVYKASRHFNKPISYETHDNFHDFYYACHKDISDADLKEYVLSDKDKALFKKTGDYLSPA